MNEHHSGIRALSHYLALKERMRRSAPDDLAWYEGTDKTGWHYTSITYDNYVRLFFRTIWTSGFNAEVVFQKEDAYFRVIHDVLVVDGHYQAHREQQFLEKVAYVLGGSASFRKNVWILEFLKLVHSIGWESFRQQYVSPTRGVRERLLSLKGIGPKTVKLLLNQTGICDIAKDDIWVTRFALMHGFADPFKCVSLVASAAGDTNTTVDAVLFWAGRTLRLATDDLKPVIQQN